MELGEKTTPDLPAPSVSRARRSRGRAVRNIALFAALALFAGHSLRPSEPDIHDTDASVAAYWDGVATRGGGEAFFPLDKDHEHEHESHKPKHPGHGKHCGRWMSPERAEKIYLSVPTNDSAAAASLRYTSKAHPAGSGWDYATALWVKADWERALGVRVTGPDDNVYDAGSGESQARIRGKPHLGVWIDTYYPVLNTPVGSSVTLLSDPPVSAKLREEYRQGDPDSKLADEVRVFHGLSVSGDVTGRLVYAGYGRKQDFDLLQAKGVDFTDKIVLVKYGIVFRGLKVKAAQEAGAIGCIIYSDPGDDGEITEANGYKQYPEGPARVPSSVQRGSVQFLSMYPGDPTTPGRPAYKNATREAGVNIPSIPSLPMSYEDAIPLLNALRGKGFSAADLDGSFSGGLGFYGVDYFTGPSEVDVHLVNEVNTRVMPIWNTMAVIPGHVQDEVVVVGNHRDAWVLGGADPNSGTASQYEMVRGLGKLLGKGWRPLRTILLASWDGEEYGLVGSTEWAEDFGDWLQTHAAAYLNLDSSAAGQNFHGSASPSLARLLRGAAEDVEKSATPGRSVWEARHDGGDWDAFHAQHNPALLSSPPTAQDDGATGITPLGSGSDYTAFLMRYGVASTDFSFGGGPKDAVYHYHSIYDSHTWMAKYGDPQFHRHADGAKIIGLTALRLADSLILPLNTTQYAHDMRGYLEKVSNLASSGNYTLDLTSLSASIDSLALASASLDKRRHSLLARLRKLVPRPPRTYLSHLSHFWRHALGACGLTQSQPQSPLDDNQTLYLTHPPLLGKKREIVTLLRAIRRINQRLRAFESGFISQDGITDREWYKHKGTSPGKWLGYGATTFPALTEALTIEHDQVLAQKEADALAGMIKAMGNGLLEIE